MRFHENSETEQVGVVAPGGNQTETGKILCYLSLCSPNTARQMRRVRVCELEDEGRECAPVWTCARRQSDGRLGNIARQGF